MPKPLSYILFGFGKMNIALFEKLKSENIQLIDEVVWASTTYKNFKSDRRASKFRKEGHTASIILTAERFVAVRGSRFLINIPHSDPRVSQLKISAEKEKILVVEYDANLFNKSWSGTIINKFGTKKALDFLHQNELFQQKLQSNTNNFANIGE